MYREEVKTLPLLVLIHQVVIEVKTTPLLDHQIQIMVIQIMVIQTAEVMVVAADRLEAAVVEEAEDNYNYKRIN